MGAMDLTSRHPNDCAIVACAAYFGVPYEDVRREFFEIGLSLGIIWQVDKGTPEAISRKFCERRGMRFTTTIPRRGQHQITGIVSLHSAGAHHGHMVAMIDGVVFDAAFPGGIPIKEYQARVTMRHIRRIGR
jgi:hypothetical protein